MKLLVFTDTHGDEQIFRHLEQLIAEESPDMLVDVGDFTFFGNDTERIIGWLDSHGLPTVLIHGNHEDEAEVESLVKRSKNLHWAHGRIIEVNGLEFFGFGGHGFKKREPELEQLDKELGHKITSRTIVLSHPPPHETALDQIEPGWHVGCMSLNDLIEKRLPMLVLCGHIHETFHERDEILGVPIINPGPDGEIIEVED